MGTKIDGKKILKELQQDKDRKKVSLYLSESTYEAFKKSCGKVSASLVMERLMQEFIDSVKKRK